MARFARAEALCNYGTYKPFQAYNRTGYSYNHS